MSIFRPIYTVVVVLMGAVRTRQLLIQAQRRGMCHGDFAFFGLDALRADILSPQGWHSTSAEEDVLLQQESQQICETFFVMALRFKTSDPQFKAFAKRVLAEAHVPEGSSPPDVNYLSTSFHDAVVVYAIVMNETAAEGRDLSTDDADYIADKFNNRIFQGTDNDIYIYI